MSVHCALKCSSAEEGFMTFAKGCLFVAVFLVVTGAAAWAQTTSGTISGHVSDPQGLPLPGVTINASSPKRICSRVTPFTGIEDLPRDQS